MMHGSCGKQLLPSLDGIFGHYNMDDMIDNMSNLSVDERASMDCKYPFLMYDYVKSNRHRCTIDLFVTFLSKEFFKPRVLPNGRLLELCTVMPRFFVHKRRMMKANADAAFTEDTHKATAYRKEAKKVEEEHGLLDDSDAKVVGKPQVIKLPFKCEEAIVGWEAQFHRNKDPAFEGLTTNAFHCILSIDLVSVIKPKKRSMGGHGVIDDDDDEEENEDDDDEEMPQQVRS